MAIWETGKKNYKVLSLDGGGTWSLIQAKVLMDLFGEDCSAQDVLDNFDMVVSNSGGSVVVAGLIEGLSLKQICRLFSDKKERAKIFSGLPFWRMPWSFFGVGPRFSTSDKLGELKKIFVTTGSARMSDIKIRNNKKQEISFLMTAFDFDTERVRIIRSNQFSPASTFPKIPETMTLADAVNASSSAPIDYFDKPAASGGRRYWDGAMAGLNNPVLTAVSEAISCGVPFDDIAVISIGTGNARLPLPSTGINPALCKTLDDTGFLTAVRKGVCAVLDDPPDTGSFIAHLMVGGLLPIAANQCPYDKTSIIRMNPLIQPVVNSDGKWDYPPGWTSWDFMRLKNMDMVASKQEDVDLITRFCDDWMKGRFNNQPIRSGALFDATPSTPGSQCEIGHHRYADVKSAARELLGFLMKNAPANAISETPIYLTVGSASKSCF
jgi:hypothetical protein